MDIPQKKPYPRIFLDIISIIGIAILYFASAKFGLTYASVNPSATAIWPPTGIAIASLLLFGVRAWPGIFIGAFFANLTTAGTTVTSLGIAIGNTLEAVVGAYLVTTYCHGKKAFEQSRDVFGFIFFAGIIATIISASVGTATLLAGGYLPLSALSATWLTWWLGDMGGALTVAPLFITLYAVDWKKWRLRRGINSILSLSLLTLVTGLIFHLFAIIPITSYHFTFVVIPPLLWIAFAVGQEGVAVGVLIVSAIATWGTLHGLGPFSLLPPDQSLLLLQIFLGILAATMMSMASVVAERQRARDAVAMQERRFRKLIENSFEIISLTDAHARIFYISPSAERILGFSPAELIGIDTFSLIHPDMVADARKQFADILVRPGASLKIQIRLKTKHDAWTSVETIFTNLFHDPDVNGIVINYRDINKEREIERLRADLLSLASHQLRTPLSGTKWLIDTLLLGTLGPLNAKQKEYIEFIYNSNERMIKLVFDMLSVLRIESETVSLTPTVINGEAFCNDLFGLLAATAHKRNVPLRCITKHLPLPFQTDPFLLKQIIQSFLSNAVEYSSPGSEVTLGIEGTATSITFSVHDTGIGIPAQEQPRIFERFYRASNAKAHKPDGTGLGLYITGILAKKINATVWFESEIGKGSTFYLKIPLISN